MSENDLRFADAHSPIRIGILSDTHGRLPENLTDTLGPVDAILHAGDIGDPSVLITLAELAPVYAVRGNMDHGAWTRDLPEDRMMQFGSVTVYMRHILADLDLDPAAAGVQMVIHGHTHRPDMVRRHGVDFLNPGSLSYPRHGQSPTLATIICGNGGITARIIPVADE